MKFRLDQIETRLQAIIEGGAARLFSAGSPVPDLGPRILAAMRANLHPHADGVIWAPNLYTLVLNPAQAESLATNTALLNELADLLWRTGSQAGLLFVSFPTIQVTPDPSFKPGDLQVRSQYLLEDSAQTTQLDTQVDEKVEDMRTNAFLIVNGTEIFPLTGPVVNIGRSSDNHLTIDDPRVSRYHAQLRLVRGRYVLFDLDSTGGTYVNKQRVIESMLFPGDVILLAGFPLIFGQDDSHSPTETQEYRPEMG